MDIMILLRWCQDFGTLYCHISMTFSGNHWESLVMFASHWNFLRTIWNVRFFFVGSQQDLLIPCLCNLAKIWICVILVRWCQDLTLCTATFGILWKSLGIFGDVQKSLGLLQHHSKCQVFFKQTQEIKRRKSHAFDI